MENNKYQQLLEDAIALNEEGSTADAILLYKDIIKLDPNWFAPCYNLGLIYKYQLEWQLSYQYNLKAVELGPDEDPAWWNLGIAATALLDWRTARRAWNKFGLQLDINDEEIQLNMGHVPIRLNPDTDGEVVWCKRIDPARSIILNVPLPASKHRYGDLLLNDGVEVGTRISEGKEYFVFNELQLISASVYKTYSLFIDTIEEAHITQLKALCDDAEVEMEDWSTVRILCKQCSEGTPHEHHDNDLKNTEREESHIGFASYNADSILAVLEAWRTITLREHSPLQLELE